MGVRPEYVAVQTLAERITEHVPQDAPLVLAGDFNDWRRDLFKILEDKLGLVEAFKSLHGEHAKSFPALKPTLHVDRVYYRGLKLLSASCLSEKPWRNLSDHLPLFASFQLAGNGRKCPEPLNLVQKHPMYVRTSSGTEV